MYSQPSTLDIVTVLEEVAFAILCVLKTINLLYGYSDKSIVASSAFVKVFIKVGLLEKGTAESAPTLTS